MTTNKNQVLDALIDVGSAATIERIAKKTGLSHSQVSGAMHSLINKGFAERMAYGIYRPSDAALDGTPMLADRAPAKTETEILLAEVVRKLDSGNLLLDIEGTLGVWKPVE